MQDGNIKFWLQMLPYKDANVIIEIDFLLE